MINRKFIISVKDSSAVQQDHFWNEIEQYENVTIWHWLESTWLITTNNPEVDIKFISDLVNENFPNNYFIINEVKIINWKAKGPNTKEKNMFTWLFKFWKTERRNIHEIT